MVVIVFPTYRLLLDLRLQHRHYPVQRHFVLQKQRSQFTLVKCFVLVFFLSPVYFSAFNNFCPTKLSYFNLFVFFFLQHLMGWEDSVDFSGGFTQKLSIISST